MPSPDAPLPTTAVSGSLPPTTAVSGSLPPRPLAALPPEAFAHLRRVHGEFTELMESHRFAMRQVQVKLENLRDELALGQGGSPIEHISARLKSMDSVLDKVVRRKLAPTMEAIREEMDDIAGIRVTCAFAHDVYAVCDALAAQDDVRLLARRDFIAEPLLSGYRSLHAIVEVPVYLSDGTVRVPVEVQFRTVAQDFWASISHRISYKYDGRVPKSVRRRLRDVAAASARLDDEMAELHEEVHGSRGLAQGAVADTGEPHGDGRGHHLSSEDPALTEGAIQRFLDYAVRVESGAGAFPG